MMKDSNYGKSTLQCPKPEGCMQHHAAEGYKKGCACCALLNKQRKEAFKSSAQDVAYRIIDPLWKTYLDLAQKKNKKESKQFVVEEALQLITEEHCPWSNKTGIRLWNNVLIELARLKDDSYIPVIKVKERNKETGRMKTVTKILW